MFHFKSPSTVLKELGIIDPEDIWLEAIAQYCGATIRYEQLEGAEARIIGYRDRAIITIDSRLSPERKRFCAGHELGHWMNDRGRVSFACTAKMFVREWSNDNPERRANRYATELLLPEAMFIPRAKNQAVTFETVRSLASEFQTSLTATAIRLVDLGSFPAMIICNEGGKRIWFSRGPDVPKAIWPKDRPGPYTNAQALLKGQQASEGPIKIGADEWIEHEDAWRYLLIEDSVKITGNLVLSLLWWEDEKQLLDIEFDDE